MTRPKVSIVITSHNEKSALIATLRNVTAQIDDSRLPAEIIVVDDRSTDGTTDAVAGLRLRGLKLLRIEQAPDQDLTTRQYAIDLALGVAVGEVFVMMDADSTPSKEWLARLVAPVFAGRSDAVAGPVSFAGRNILIAAWQSADTAYYHTFCALLNAAGLSAGVFFGNFACRKNVYDDLGGFTRIGFALTEDLAFARALHAKGFRIAYTTDQIVEVAASSDWGSMLQRMTRITSGGFSALSFAITTWMLALPALAVAALLAGAPWTWLLLARYGCGIGITGYGLLRTGQWRKVPMALLHDMIGMIAGAVVVLRVLRNNRVDWGGNAYMR